MAPSVYAFGSNSNGQLAIGHTHDTSQPTKCIFHAEEPSIDDIAVAIAAGGNHTLLRYNTGAVFAAGYNTDGRCGLPETIHDSDQFPGCLLRFRRVRFHCDDGQLLEDFSDVSATNEASFFLTKSGDVYAAGTGIWGELGLGSICHAPQPKRVHIPTALGNQIERLVSGVRHSIALGVKAAYGWGSCHHGELPVPIQAVIISEPQKIHLDPAESDPQDTTNHIHVTCGMHFTYIFREASPRESHIQFGPSLKHSLRSGSASPSLTHIPACKDVAAGWNSIHLTTEDGHIISWGKNNYKQLAPPLLQPGGSGTIVRLVAGSEHVLAEGVDGKIITWGWGTHGNCGPDYADLPMLVEDGNGKMEKQEFYEIDVEGLKLSLLGAGCATSWVVALEDRSSI